MMFKLDHFHRVEGRGLIAVGEYNDGHIPVIGETVTIDGKVYEIRGVEMSRILTSPPRIETNIGLLVKEVKDDK